MAKAYEIFVTDAVQVAAGGAFAFEELPDPPPGAGAVHRLKSQE